MPRFVTFRQKQPYPNFSSMLLCTATASSFWNVSLVFCMITMANMDDGHQMCGMYLGRQCSNVNNFLLKNVYCFHRAYTTWCLFISCRGGTIKHTQQCHQLFMNPNYRRKTLYLHLLHPSTNVSSAANRAICSNGSPLCSINNFGHYNYFLYEEVATSFSWKLWLLRWQP